MRHFGIFLVVVALVLSGCASTRSGYSFTQLRNVGEKYLAASDAPNALKFLTLAEAQRPDDPSTQYDLGLAYQKRGLESESIAHFQKALKLKPRYPEASNALGVVYAERGQVELARECFQKALSDPLYQTPQLASFNLGRLYEKKSDLNSALREYEQAVKFYPGYGLAWYKIGTIMETMHRTDEARNAYGKAIRATPDLAEAHMRYGMMAFHAGDLESALFSLERVTRLVPNTSMADEARRELEKVKIAIVKSRPKPSRLRQVSPDYIQSLPRNDIPQRQSQNASSPPGWSRSDNLAPIPKEAPPAAPVAHGAPVEVVQSSNGPVLSNRPQTTPASAAPALPQSPLAGAKPDRDPHRDISAVAGAAQPALPEHPVAVATPSAPAAGAAPASPDVVPAAPEPPQFNYIVQLGSFAEKAKADELRKRLREKGYAAVVKRLKHKATGLVYIIELKPESSQSKAATLKVQLGTEVSGDIKIIKVPAEAK